MGGLTIENWIAIFAAFIAAIGASFTGANYLAGRRERQRNAQKSDAKIRATINARYYEGGWRSVQLCVVSLHDDQPDFRFENWRIERATLLRPKTAILARAADDDYASGVFNSKHAVRSLEGKTEGRARWFVLEFFIKFLGSERGQEAVFRVIFSHSKTGKRFTTLVSASAPANLEIRNTPESAEGQKPLPRKR